MEKQKKTAVKRAVKSAAPKSSAKPAAGASAGKNSAKPKSVPSIKKQYSRTRPVCKVTFVLPEAAAPSASSVCIAGDFNNWSITEHPLKRQRSGDYSISIEVEPGRQYQFRYIIDGMRWENDWHADKYVPTGYGDTENSVVIV